MKHRKQISKEDRAFRDLLLKNDYIRILLQGWVKALQAGSDPSSYARKVVKIAYNSSDRKRQKAYGAFLSTVGMVWGRWPKARQAIWEYWKPETQEAFSLPTAKAFYVNFRKTVMGLVAEVWKKFCAKKRKSHRIGDL